MEDGIDGIAGGIQGGVGGVEGGVEDGIEDGVEDGIEDGIEHGVAALVSWLVTFGKHVAPPLPRNAFAFVYDNLELVPAFVHRTEYLPSGGDCASDSALL